MAFTISSHGHPFNLVKDPPDYRDYGVGSLMVAKAVEPSVTLLPVAGPVLDQLTQGSCTAHAAASDREIMHWSEYTKQGKTVAPTNEGLYSPSFIYYLERQEDGTLDQGDIGSYGRTSCRVLKKYGCALRSDFPYNPADFSTAPTSDQLTAALKWPTGNFHRIGTVQDMKNCLAYGNPFRIGFNVYESFEEDIGSDGVWTPRGTNLGGHQVLAIGYDDSINGGSFQVRNSWGERWGQHGNFWLRYQDAADPRVLMDAWIQHLGVWK